VEPQAGDEGGGLPVAMRDGGAQPLTSGRAAPQAGHFGGGPGLVDEHQPGRIEVELGVEPGFATLQDVRPLLLGGMRSLFLSVIWWRSKKRHRLEAET
jgi:hypothetical protein